MARHENGKTLFFQNEMPYDVPDQAAWTSGNGWAAYKVGAGVQAHEAWGLGSQLSVGRPGNCR